MSGTLEVVVGAQFGSEAKGHIVQRLTERKQRNSETVQVVRVAGPNAGHTGYDATGQAWALRQVPVAAVTDGSAILGIAAGSEIDLPVLLDEYDKLKANGLLGNKMLWVSGVATLITDEHKEQEGGAELVKKIGSTGKGIGAARADRIMRKAQRVCDNEEALEALAERGIAVADHRQRIVDIAPPNHALIIEGTQGYGLGLHGEFYPQCTSSNCRAIDFMAMAGVSPWDYEHSMTWAVARMFPIRVAGNSGPLQNETTWEDLGLPEERTTVTKKVRRVGMPDWGLVRQAVMANGGPGRVALAVTMVDQMFPFIKDLTYEQAMEEATAQEMFNLQSYLGRINQETGVSVGMITTGPNCASFML